METFSWSKANLKSLAIYSHANVCDSTIPSYLPSIIFVFTYVYCRLFHMYCLIYILCPWDGYHIPFNPWGHWVFQKTVTCLIKGFKWDSWSGARLTMIYLSLFFSMFCHLGTHLCPFPSLCSEKKGRTCLPQDAEVAAMISDPLTQQFHAIVTQVIQLQLHGSGVCPDYWL